MPTTNISAIHFRSYLQNSGPSRFSSLRLSFAGSLARPRGYRSTLCNCIPSLDILLLAPSHFFVPLNKIQSHRDEKAKQTNKQARQASKKKTSKNTDLPPSLTQRCPIILSSK
ncbi:hypothetical protein WAI453_000543 [Rhynchosporium graminicola]